MVRIPDPNKTFVQTLFEDAKERALAQGIRTENEYRDLVNEVVEEQITQGRLSNQDDWEQIKRDLVMMWPELTREIEQ